MQIFFKKWKSFLLFLNLLIYWLIQPSVSKCIFFVISQRIKHSQLPRGVERALIDKNIISKADIMQLECCYLTIMQSGADYDLKFTTASDQNYLDFGMIVCSFDVRYKSYWSNLSRAMFIKPLKTLERMAAFF